MTSSSSESLGAPGGSMASSTTSNEIKVYYYCDDDPTPFVSIIPCIAGVATLGDFKKALAKRGYKYYGKQLDSDIGCEVKVEFVDDDHVLRKSQNGLYELYLLTHSTLSRPGTLPRPDKMMGVEMIGKSRRRRSLVELDGYPALSMPSIATESHPASSLGTVISRRAGEQLAEFYTSNSEDPYRYDDSSRLSSGMSTSLYDAPGRGPPYGVEKVRQRRPRKKFRKAYVPSTISSATESSLSLPQILEVFLPMNNASYLGISVGSYEGAILITDIRPDGAVGRDGRISVGDQILRVNNKSLEPLSEKQAVALLCEIARAKRPVKLFIAKNAPQNAVYDPLASLALSETTMPLDISTWVRTAVICTERERLGNGTMLDEADTFGEGTLDPIETDDDEERQLYEMRRNGVPPAALEDARRRRENEVNEHHARIPRMPDPYPAELYSSTMDPILILRAMAKPESGLQVKNRKWLKILVPMSFIGGELVDWLLEHVKDLHDRKAARSYAARLLEAGLIRHVVSKLSFTEKCYYVFGDAVVGVRGAADSTQTSSGTIRAEATTEVTYVGSPAPPGMRIPPTRNVVHQQQHVAPSLEQPWPISPITVFDNTRSRANRRKDCESPLTNDYASMVGVESTTSYGRGVGRGMLLPRAPPPNTPLSGNGSAHATGSLLPPPHPSPCETEFEDDDKRRILKK